MAPKILLLRWNPTRLPDGTRSTAHNAATALIPPHTPSALLWEALVHHAKEPAVLGAVGAADGVELRLQVASPHGRLVCIGDAQVMALTLTLTVKLKLVLGHGAVLTPRGGPHEDGHVREGVAVLEVAAVHTLRVVVSLEHIIPKINEGHCRRRHSGSTGELRYEGLVLLGNLVSDLHSVLPRVIIGQLVLHIRRNLLPCLPVVKHRPHCCSPRRLWV
mmetsp:Transcript_37764/g.88286  ORF Transcript_37764/g.88286 Transcript_37764/m.88286 type:complete len:218 (+) Transcript_37764:198-851(+)